MIRSYIDSLLHGRHRAARLYRPMNRITLDRAAMLKNFSVLSNLHPEKSIIAVLKSNAYGHGLQETAEILNSAPCAFIAVDGYFEAARIRFVTKHPILVLGYCDPANSELLDTKRCAFVVQDAIGLKAFGQLRRPVRIHIELNTGMNRLGLSSAEIDEYLNVFTQYPLLTLDGIMTHLADADNADNAAFTRHQTDMFDTLVRHILERGFTPSYIHIAQTAGSTKVTSTFANAMRVGIGLYGINPLTSSDRMYPALHALHPVLALHSTVIKTIPLKAGDTVGYNRTFRATKPTIIGVLPLGFYEGIPRTIANRGFVSSEYGNFPIIGKICMNHTMIDLGDSDITTGREVTVISDDPIAGNSIASLCSTYELFPYELFAKLSENVRRQII